jgi:hypothetical protein
MPFGLVCLLMLNTAFLISGAPMTPYPWWQYPIIGLIYTATVFAGQFAPQRLPVVFSKQNSRTLSVILLGHAGFLAVFLGSIWIACSNLSSMPDWFIARGFIIPSRHGIHRVSLLDLVFLILLLVLWAIELRCIYAEAKTDGPQTYKNPAVTNSMGPSRLS